MNLIVISDVAYHRRMTDDGLPHPAEALTLAEIAGEPARVTAMLENGGAVLVLTDDRCYPIGVLTRKRPLLDETMTAVQIDAGTLPAIEELLAMDERGELP